jgi:hypothetical protein
MLTEGTQIKVRFKKFGSQMHQSLLFPCGRISKKGAFFALKGLHIPAQGNALGNTLQ